MGKLTLKQEAFAAAYLRLQNASAAYREAYDAKGMSETTINVEACKLLKNPKVAHRVGQVVERAADKLQLTIDDTLHYLSAVVSFDKRKLYKEDGSRKSYSELDEATALAISHEGKTDVIPHDKLRAIDMSMKYLGLYEKDNSQRAENLNLQVVLVAAPGRPL